MPIARRLRQSKTFDSDSADSVTIPDSPLKACKPYQLPGRCLRLPAIDVLEPTPVARNSQRGLTTVLATVLKGNVLYVLELNDAPGFPSPGNGKVVRMIGTTITTIATGLTVPTGMTLGPDGNLYVSNFGALPAPAAGQALGQVVKITLP